MFLCRLFDRTPWGVFIYAFLGQDDKSEMKTDNIRGPRFKLLELCPRGNNKDVIIIILVHDNVYIPC
jgi:hypothetical protein